MSCHCILSALLKPKPYIHNRNYLPLRLIMPFINQAISGISVMGESNDFGDIIDFNAISFHRYEKFKNLPFWVSSSISNRVFHYSDIFSAPFFYIFSQACNIEYQADASVANNVTSNPLTLIIL